MRSIRSYLPHPDQTDKTVIIQARISEKMKEMLRELADKNRWKASDVIRASLQKFLDDEKRTRHEQ